MPKLVGSHTHVWSSFIDSDAQHMITMIPDGFQACPSGTACPACQSSLLQKIGGSSERAPTVGLASNLEAARCANLLLQALSFDASTREKPCSPIDPVSGVSYCPECQVHVITAADQLVALFDQLGETHDELGVEDVLRGRLFVAMDDTHLSPIKQYHPPRRPADFDYEYRHSLATMAMGTKLNRGFRLLDELCAHCEMPLMLPPQGVPTCVVCPKLLEPHNLPSSPTEDSDFQIDPDDPVTLIIAEARRAVKMPTSPIHTAKIQEAKQFLAQQQLRKHTLDSNDAQTATLTPVDSHSMEGTPSFILHHWDQLLDEGRQLLSQRLQEGWTLSQKNCDGRYCKHTPLIHFQQYSNLCTVCGGTGNGLDGAYLRQQQQHMVVPWQELVTNGRALLSERLLNGWIMTSENCAGVHCKGTPLTRFDNGPLSCVVCGGAGSGFDGLYASYKSQEVQEVERALVAQEIRSLLNVGWVLRNSLCETCHMPLVAETPDSENVCILCGKDPVKDENGVPFCWDDNANEASQKLYMGWTLPENASLCENCGGVLMVPPHSKECGCINQECPLVLSAARMIPAHEGILTETANREEIPLPPSHFQTPPAAVGTSNKLNFSNILKGGLPLMVCGASECVDDQSALSDDMSQVRSVASSALGVIMARLDDAKYQLELLRENGEADETECAKKQAEIAMLIEKLANAAVAMKRMDEEEEW